MPFEECPDSEERAFLQIKGSSSTWIELYFALGHSVVLRCYSWLSAQGSLLAVFNRQVVLEINSGTSAGEVWAPPLEPSVPALNLNPWQRPSVHPQKHMGQSSPTQRKPELWAICTCDAISVRFDRLCLPCHMTESTWNLVLFLFRKVKCYI